MIKDYFRLAIKGLFIRRLRSWLTMIGIFIGIAAVVSLISLGQGMKYAINAEFMKIGADKIIISPGSGFFSAPPGSIKALDESDVELIKKVSGVKLVGEMVYKTAQIEFNNQVFYNFVTGLPQDESKRIIEDMQSFEIAEGRGLKGGDRYKTIVGKMIGDGTIFDKKVKVGDTIIVSGKEFKVVGIMKPIGNPQDDSSLLIPLDTARELFNEPEVVDAIILQVSSGANPEEVAERIKKEMRKDRDLKEGEEDFTVQTTQQLIESFNVILTIVQAVLIGIAAISLTVGGIGIMNTMYTAVLERTKEIGIMKAVGAKNQDIMLLFMIESGTLGVAGGAIGIIIGIAISKGVEYVAVNLLGTTLLKAYFPWYLIVGSLAFSYLLGSISGMLPALQASRMKPVEALRKK